MEALRVQGTLQAENGWDPLRRATRLSSPNVLRRGRTYWTHGTYGSSDAETAGLQPKELAHTREKTLFRLADRGYLWVAFPVRYLGF